MLEGIEGAGGIYYPAFQAGNVSLARRQRQCLLAAPADEDWRMWMLRRLGEARQICHSIILAGKGHGVLGEELLDKSHRLRQAPDADPRGIERQARLVVINLKRSSSQVKYKATTRELINCRHFFGQQHR